MKTSKLIWLLAVVALLGTAGGATATHLLTGRDIKDGSLSLRDFRKSERAKLRGPRGRAGAAGKTGQTGLRGVQGVAGKNGVSLYATYLTQNDVGLVPSQSSGAKSITPSAIGTYVVRFDRDLGSCSATATAEGGIATVEDFADVPDQFIVTTHDLGGAAANHSFRVIVACAPGA